MNKKSYRNKRLEKLNVKFNLNLPGQPSAEEGLSGDTQSGIGRGYSVTPLADSSCPMPGEPGELNNAITTAIYTENEDRELFDKEPSKTPPLEYDKLREVLVMLSDEMDKSALYEYSNFTDFLIKKISQQINMDYDALLRDLLIKINNSDMINNQDLIVSMVKEYNSLLSESIQAGESKESAHRNSYQVISGVVEGHV